MGLGKPRSPLGEWVDETFGRGGQAKLMEICGIDKNTATAVCSASGRKPNQSTKGRIIQGLQQAGYRKYEDDFWK
ncbi:hypothetical protein ACFFSY_29360 [Paenibacillus aurantiacus]|uniref:Transcriptional regulator n=1 Tax=Paenibacillus aurantiacus TaxID=1936118 RepID=A0ABV5KZS2_9BACL